MSQYVQLVHDPDLAVLFLLHDNLSDLFLFHEEEADHAHQIHSLSFVRDRQLFRHALDACLGPDDCFAAVFCFAWFNLLLVHDDRLVEVEVERVTCEICNLLCSWSDFVDVAALSQLLVVVLSDVLDNLSVLSSFDGEVSSLGREVPV